MTIDGLNVGFFEVGRDVFTALGAKVGGRIGESVGLFVGDADGSKVLSGVGDDDNVGDELGQMYCVGFWESVGFSVGFFVGSAVRFSVGLIVG